MILSHNITKRICVVLQKKTKKDLCGAWLGRKERKFEAEIFIYMLMLMELLVASKV